MLGCMQRRISVFRKGSSETALLQTDNDLRQLITAEDIQKFEWSAVAWDAVKITASVQRSTPALAEYVLLRDYLLANIAHSNANRSGIQYTQNCCTIFILHVQLTAEDDVDKLNTVLEAGICSQVRNISEHDRIFNSASLRVHPFSRCKPNGAYSCQWYESWWRNWTTISAGTWWNSGSQFWEEVI